MAFTPKSDEEAAQAITRLVDGTLRDAERDAVEAWAEARPDIAHEVVAQRRVSRALATDGPEVPERLLDAVEQRSRRPTASKRRVWRSGLAPVNRWRPALALGLVAVVAVAIAITTSGSSASPSISAAARLAFVASTGPAPGVSNPHYLDVSYGGVTFPNYASLNARAAGRLTSRIGGRPALTVYYRLTDGTRLSYTVFSGRPVGLPAAARLVRFRGVPLRTYRTSDGLSVVTLVRHGRTCVLAARTEQSVVLNLAAEPVLAPAV